MGEINVPILLTKFASLAIVVSKMKSCKILKYSTLEEVHKRITPAQFGEYPYSDKEEILSLW